MTEIESARTLAKKYNPNHTFVNQKPVKAFQVGQQEMKAYADSSPSRIAPELLNPLDFSKNLAHLEIMPSKKNSMMMASPEPDAKLYDIRHTTSEKPKTRRMSASRESRSEKDLD